MVISSSHRQDPRTCLFFCTRKTTSLPSSTYFTLWTGEQSYCLTEGLFLANLVTSMCSLFVEQWLVYRKHISYIYQTTHTYTVLLPGLIRSWSLTGIRAGSATLLLIPIDMHPFLEAVVTIVTIVTITNCLSHDFCYHSWLGVTQCASMPVHAQLHSLDHKLHGDIYKYIVQRLQEI